LIDLKRNLLVIGTTGTETPFLCENELPDCARLSGPRSEAESSSAVEMEDHELAKVIILLFKYAYDRQMNVFNRLFKSLHYLIPTLNLRPTNSLKSKFKNWYQWDLSVRR
jgi:hypothetical protein